MKKIFEKVILKNGEAKDIYILAEKRQGKNCLTIEKALIEKGDIIVLFRYANLKEKYSKQLIETIFEQEIKDSNLEISYFIDFCDKLPKSYMERALDKIIETKNSRYIIEFAKNYSFSDMQMYKIVKLFVEEGSSQDILKLVKNLKISQKYTKILQNEFIEKMNNNLSEIDKQIAEFINYMPNADITMFENWIIKNGSIVEICNFAKNVKGADITKVTNCIFKKSKSTGYIDVLIDFVNNVPNAPINRFEDFLINRKNIFYIIDFCKNVPNANIDKFVKSIIKTETTNNILLFCKAVDNAPIDKIFKSIEKDLDKLNKKDIVEFLQTGNLSKENAYILFKILLERNELKDVLWRFLSKYCLKDFKFADKVIYDILSKKDITYHKELIYIFWRENILYEKYINTVLDNYMKIADEKSEKISIDEFGTLLSLLTHEEEKQKIMEWYITR